MTTPEVEAAHSLGPVRTDQPRARMPWAALLAMATTGFVIIVTETLPAGLLPQISRSFGIDESWAGQFMTAYAAGAVIAAIPAVRLTRYLHRRPVLLIGIGGFLVGNSLMAFAGDFWLAMAGRLVAGAASGLLWGMIPGYARSIVRSDIAGRALAIALVGIPIGLSLGTPLGSFVGSVVSWRLTFTTMSALALVLFAWVLIALPNPAGLARGAGASIPLHHVVRLPGIPHILAVVLAWMLGHNILITYIAPFLTASGITMPVDVVLLVFGVSALVGTVLTGFLIDRMLRRLVLTSLAAFGIAGLLLALLSSSPVAVVIALVLWGLTFGSAAAPLQTASADAAAAHSDAAQSVQATVWNLAIFGGALIGGLVLRTAGAAVFPWIVAALSAIALCIALVGRTAFPAGHRSQRTAPATADRTDDAQVQGAD